jgi:hypothetical protein
MPSKDEHEILHGVLEFHAHGNYGSTVYDDLNSREYLTVNICDGCMKRLARKGQVREVTIIPRPSKLTYKRWAYDDFEDD